MANRVGIPLVGPRSDMDDPAMSPVHGLPKRLLPPCTALARPTNRGQERTGIPLYSRIFRSECIPNFISEELFRKQERR